MSSSYFRLFALLSISTLGLARASAQPSASGADPEGFRTTATALKTQVRQAPDNLPGRSGYLGVHLNPDAKGRLVIEDVELDSPAAKIGLQAGDVLKKADEREVRTAAELRDLLQGKLPGEPVKLRVERKKKLVDFQVALGATSRPMRLGERRALLGVRVGEVDEGAGAPVQTVLPDSPAARAGVRTGDVLTKIDGAALTTAARVNDSVAEKRPGDTLTLALLRDGKEVEVRVSLGEAPAQENRNAIERTVWQKDVYRLAVVAIEYPDVKHNPAITTAEWHEALFSKGTYKDRKSITGQTVHGSLNDYYLEQSCGALRVEGKFFEWVEVGKNRADYSQGTGTSRGGTSLLTEALDKLLARDGQEALKDFDGIFFLYAGDRVRTTRGGLYWPHRASTFHGGKRWPYFIVQEGGRQMSNISVICHEFGHMLGLPDLYARPENPGSEGLGIWCAMSNQAGAGRPQHMSAWCKERLGWLKPTVIDPTVRQKLILSPIESSSTECFKVLVKADGSEYLLLENRRRHGFDQSLPSEGLLIWRVVGSRPMLEESHGVDGPPGPGVFLTNVPYPSAANNAFTPYTTPSSRSQLGGGLPVYITNIRGLPDGRVSFYVGYEFQ